MSDLQAKLDRIAPLPEGRLQDWGDVLRRAGVSRRRRRMLLAAVAGAVLLAATLLVATPAFGLRATVFGTEPAPTWTWPEGIPGEPIQVPKILRSMNGDLHGKQLRGRVDLSTLRLVVTAGKGSQRESELAARGVSGAVCGAVLGGDIDRPMSIGGFGCLDRADLANRAVFVHEVAGGHRGSVVDYATITGVARADVGRVELLLANGQTVELPLNRWRGFGYHATDPKLFPKTVSVYATWSSLFRHHEKLVGEIPLQEVGGLEPTPLCGGKYGPCPSGVKP